MDDNRLTVDLEDLDQSTRDKLEKELAAQDLDLAGYVKGAVTEKMQRDQWLRAEVGRGFEDIASGRTYTLDEVKANVAKIIADARAN